MTTRVAILVGAILLLAGGVAAACSTDTDDLEARIAALEAAQGANGDSDGMAALRAEIMQANAIATLNTLAGAGLHELEEEIMETGLPPDGSVGAVRTALRAAAATAWPEALAADADGLKMALSSFLAALQDEGITPEDLQAASSNAHSTWHLFTDDAWTYLGESAGLTDVGGEDHEEHEEGEENMGEMEHEEEG